VTVQEKMRPRPLDDYPISIDHPDTTKATTFELEGMS
jgi:hypothetical protein